MIKKHQALSSSHEKESKRKDNIKLGDGKWIKKVCKSNNLPLECYKVFTTLKTTLFKPI